MPEGRRPTSSTFATVPIREYRSSTLGTSSSVSSAAPAAATAVRASSDSSVSVTTMPGSTTPVVSGSSGRIWVSRSAMFLVSWK